MPKPLQAELESQADGVQRHQGGETPAGASCRGKADAAAPRRPAPCGRELAERSIAEQQQAKQQDQQAEQTVRDRAGKVNAQEISQKRQGQRQNGFARQGKALAASLQSG